MSVSACLLLATAGKAFCDDLRGYSIDAAYTSIAAFGTYLIGAPPRDQKLSVRHHDRVYVSTLGNVFDYSDASSGQASSHLSNETAPNGAKTLPGGRMQGWTIEPGRLIRIEKQIEGFLVETIAIDLARSSCSVSYEVRPDPQTGRVVRQLLTGQTAVLTAYPISEATCALRKGNIFASDQ
jgi:hypothetical protein